MPKRSGGAIALAGILLLTSLVGGSPVNVDAAAPSALLVSKSASSPPPGDVALRDRLIGLGYDVVVADDNAVDAADADGQALVVLSTSVQASLIGSMFTDVETPLLAYEPHLYDDLGFSAASGPNGQTGNATTVRIVDESHPIASGFSGDVTTTTRSMPATFGTPLGDVDVIGVEPRTAARAEIFAYERGAQMAEVPAPQRRVGFYPVYATATAWTDDGATLFDNAVAWLTNGEPPANTAPQVDAGDDVTIAVDTAAALAGTVADDGLPVADPALSWTGPAGVDFADPTAAATTATFPGIGTYELTLTADDTELTADDTITVTVSVVVPPDDLEVLWVTSSANAPSVERPGIERLEAADMMVTVADDDKVTAQDAADKDLVIITSRVTPTKIRDQFTDVAVPVMIWEPFLYDDMGFIGPGGTKGQASGRRSIIIDAPDDILAAGLSGTPTVLTKKQTMSWAKPGGDARIIASVDNAPTKAVLFAYPTGTAMHVGIAPARRLGYFLAGGGPLPHNDDGWRLWDAAIDWALNGDGPPVVAPMAVAEASATTGEIGATVTFDASASTDDRDAIVSYDWDFDDGTTASGVEAVHQFSTSGSFEVTVTITDDEGATDSATVVVDITAGWAGAQRHFRAPLVVSAGTHERTDAVITTEVDFGTLLRSLGSTDPTFDPNSITVVEVDGDSNIINGTVPFQFDPADTYEATDNAVGELVLVLDGTTPADTERTFDLYFDTAGHDYEPPTFSDEVVTTTGVDENRSAIEFDTPSGDWWYDVEGGGFSSLDDNDGKDWISYNSAAGADGQFRGIPNAVFPEGYFHPGGTGMVTQILHDGPLRATVESASPDGRYTARWNVYPDRAEMQMLQAAGPYWFLYEGTPGGVFNRSADRIARPNGSSKTLGSSFKFDLGVEEWVYFSDPFVERSLMVGHFEDDTIIDRYFGLDDSMTVFGFGRGSTTTPLLTETPQTFVVGLLDGVDFTPTSASIRATLEPPTSTVGPIVTRLPGAVPPSALATVTPTSGIAPLDVSADGSASTDDGSIVSYHWDLDDGVTADTAAASPTFADSGRRLLTLTVTDDVGMTDTAEFIVSVGRPAFDRVTDGLIALYEFDETSGTSVADTSNAGSALDLTIADSAAVSHLAGGGLRVDTATTIESQTPATKIIDAVTASDEVTVEAWIATSDDTQNGPARIISVSTGPTDRNLTVGQGVFGEGGGRIETRLRTTTTDSNGRPAIATPNGTLGETLTHVVYTRTTNGIATIYIDGQIAATGSVAGDLSNWDPTATLLFGAEADGSRNWLGEYHLVAMYDRALSRQDVCLNHGAGPAHGLPTENLAPTACLSASPMSAPAPALISFDASFSHDLDGSIANVHWNFGDGAIRNGIDDAVEHRYDEVGSYTVIVTVTDDDGATSTTSTIVEVTTPRGGRLAWTRIESPDPRLPDPRAGLPNDHQTATHIGDLDGDGDDDFVIAGRREPGPSIVWYEYVDETIGWVPHDIEAEILPIDAGGAIHDIDGDGDLDLAFGADGSSSEVWWWANPGPANVATDLWERHLIKEGGGRQHHDMLFADVDDDGTAEFIYWNQRPRPGGEKLFLAEVPAEPTIGPWPATLIYQGTAPSEGLDAVDIDLDGMLDIVGAGMWLKRQPNGTFVTNEIDLDYTFSRTETGQLIPGGRPEVVISSGDFVGPLAWYEWNASTGAWDANILEDVATYGHSLDVADVDGDGHLDIFSAEMMSPFDHVNAENPDAEVLVYFGDSTGDFLRNVVDTGFDNHESKLGDIDNDGDLDIVGKPFNFGSPGVNLWINDGINHFDNWTRSAIDEVRPWTSLFVKHADVDGDGFADVITGGWWYRNPGTADGTWIRNTIGAPLYNVADIADLDGDGDIDVIGTAWKTTADSPNSQFSWGRNDGAGNFEVFAAVTTDDGPFLQGATIGELESGGPLELVLGWNNRGGSVPTKTITVPDDLASNPDQAPWAQSTLSPIAENEEILIDDVDLDGDNDVVLGRYWLRNDPGATWTDIEIFTPRTGESDRLRLADVDLDGDDDLVLGNGHDPNGEVSWYERPADPEDPWTHHLIANLVNPQSLDVTDFDGDGDIDIVVGEHNLDNLPASQLLIYENLGTGADWEVHRIHVGDEHHDGAQLVDLDNDGDLDVVSIGFIENKVIAYYNRTGE